ncbi:MAG: type II toxin-antitoxin system RelE/ParE family toxin [Gammaproteobacteria bacterium]|nr:type II toxin-antitoxin system RelE/ParE family toxin [Gammaproteobacteria bacterium]
MPAKPVVPRELANRDIDDAITYYLSENAEQAALGFVDALEQAYAHISRHPATGSPRYAHELNLPSLRFWPLARYPYLVFYVERPEHIDVWRVLHGQRDIPAWMQEPETL